MRTQTTRTIELRGYLVGAIWWPVGAECWKDLAYDITREDARFSEPGTLRDHVLAATNDGDFQGCTIAQGELIATSRTIAWDDSGRVLRETTRRHHWPLDRFKSVADCLHDDPDWLPSYPEDDE